MIFSSHAFSIDPNLCILFTCAVIIIPSNLTSYFCLSKAGKTSDAPAEVPGHRQQGQAQPQVVQASTHRGRLEVVHGPPGRRRGGERPHLRRQCL